MNKKDLDIAKRNLQASSKLRSLCTKKKISNSLKEKIINIKREKETQGGEQKYQAVSVAVLAAELLLTAAKIRKKAKANGDLRGLRYYLCYYFPASARSSQMSAISIARYRPFFSLDFTSCLRGERYGSVAMS